MIDNWIEITNIEILENHTKIDRGVMKITKKTTKVQIQSQKKSSEFKNHAWKLKSDLLIAIA